MRFLICFSEFNTNWCISSTSREIYHTYPGQTPTQRIVSADVSPWVMSFKGVLRFKYTGWTFPERHLLLIDRKLESLRARLIEWRTEALTNLWLRRHIPIGIEPYLFVNYNRHQLNDGLRRKYIVENHNKKRRGMWRSLCQKMDGSW